MKHYIDTDGTIYAYESDGSQDAFIKPGLRLLSAEELAEIRRPPPPPVPQTVTRFQARAALLAAGMLDQVEQMMAQASPIAKLAWAEALEFKRTSPTVLAMAQALGLTDAQLDGLFTQAAGIEA